MKVQTMEQRAEAETERRKRKEGDLRAAERRIEQLESTIKQLEEMVEKNPKKTRSTCSSGIGKQADRMMPI